jgi:hypothetical protein
MASLAVATLSFMSGEKLSVTSLVAFSKEIPASSAIAAMFSLTFFFSSSVDFSVAIYCLFRASIFSRFS